MIDQRILPAEFKYISYTTANQVAGGIRDMVVRGAPAIGCAAAYGVALAALNLQDASNDKFNQGMEEAFEVFGYKVDRPPLIYFGQLIECAIK